jgi:hypothetical protein
MQSSCHKKLALDSFSKTGRPGFVRPLNLLGGGGEYGVKSYDGENAWSSTNTPLTTLCLLAQRQSLSYKGDILYF